MSQDLAPVVSTEVDLASAASRNLEHESDLAAILKDPAIRVFERKGKLSKRDVGMVATTVAIYQGRQIRQERRLEIVAPRQSWFSIGRPWGKSATTTDADSLKQGFWDKFNWTAAVAVLGVLAIGFASYRTAELTSLRNLISDKDKTISEKNDENKSLRDELRDKIQESTELWDKLVKNAEEKTSGLSPEDKQKLADIYSMIQKYMPKQGKGATAGATTPATQSPAASTPTSQTKTTP